MNPSNVDPLFESPKDFDSGLSHASLSLKSQPLYRSTSTEDGRVLSVLKRFLQEAHTGFLQFS